MLIQLPRTPAAPLRVWAGKGCGGRGEGDINIALPKPNTLSRGNLPPKDQRSKLLKVLGADFDGAARIANSSRIEREANQKSASGIQARMRIAMPIREGRSQRSERYDSRVESVSRVSI